MVVASVLSAICLLILPINLTASAVNVVDDSFQGKVVVLPFPSPSSFGNNSKSIVVYDDTSHRYYMYTLVFEPTLAIPSDSVSFTLSPTSYVDDSKSSFNGFSLQVNLKLDQSVSETSVDTLSVYCRLYMFSFGYGNSTYSCTHLTLRGINDVASFLLAFNQTRLKFNYSSSSSSFPTSYVGFFNGSTYGNLDSYGSLFSTSVVYSFSSDANGFLLSQIADDFDTAHFYLQQILDKLGDNGGYSPSETTTNSDMSNYEQAEGALVDNNIDALNNMELPNLSDFNSGNQGNAFQFISSNIEFFSGMNGTGSIAKVGSVLLVVLGLGLTSFIIGLSNRRKG